MRYVAARGLRGLPMSAPRISDSQKVTVMLRGLFIFVIAYQTGIPVNNYLMPVPTHSLERKMAVSVTRTPLSQLHPLNWAYKFQPKWENTRGKEKKLHIVINSARVQGLKIIGTERMILRVSTKTPHELVSLYNSLLSSHPPRFVPYSPIL